MIFQSMPFWDVKMVVNFNVRDPEGQCKVNPLSMLVPGPQISLLHNVIQRTSNGINLHNVLSANLFALSWNDIYLNL
jgi:hypothetical protein